MKTITLLLSIFISYVIVGQNATFTNPLLENYLMNVQSLDTTGDGSPDAFIDSNADGQIELSEIQFIDNLTINQGVGDVLTDLVQFTNLQKLILRDYNHGTIDFSGNTSITEVDMTLAPTTVPSFDIELNNIESFFLILDYAILNGSFTQIPDINFLPSQNIEYLNLRKLNYRVEANLMNLNISSLINLKKFESLGLNVSDLEITNLVNLEDVYIFGGSAADLDFSNALGLKKLNLTSLDELTTLNIDNNIQLVELWISLSLITDLNYQNKINLEKFTYDLNNQLSVDFSNLLNLKELYLADYSTPIDFDFSPLINLEKLRFSWINLNNELDLTVNTQIKELKFDNNTFVPSISGNFSNLERLEISSSSMESLDLGSVPNLSYTWIENVSSLEYIGIENSTDSSFYYIFDLPDLISLSLRNNTISARNFTLFGFPQGVHICVDEDRRSEFENEFNYLSPVVNSYCAFTPAGEYSEIQGSTIIDVNVDGCDTSDPVYSSLNFLIDDGSESGFVTGKQNGIYYLPVAESGQYTITPQPENPSYWNFNPTSVTVDFPTQASPFTQDFCVTPNGTVEDLEVIVLGLEDARPGFETDYRVVVKNKGNQTVSGNLTLDYDSDYMNLLNSTPSAGTSNNQLDWSFTGIAPFEMLEFDFTMTLNTPTDANFPLASNDELLFTGSVSGTGNDQDLTDNTMVLNQIVVNSFDPNDKRCLEGDKITPSMVGEYVHYMIRFENTGTASAINVVVKDAINPMMFDVSTFVPLGGSHDYYVRTVGDGNTFEFIHENINLDFNDATNDGYVLFKIKTLPTLTEGDTFSNDAEIYFDFNAPIITNDFITTVNATASIASVEDSSIKIYPNPTSGFLNLSASTGIESVLVMDAQGRILSITDFISSNLTQQIDLTQQGSGIYFLKITTEKGIAVEKVVVE